MAGTRVTGMGPVGAPMTAAYVASRFAGKPQTATLPHNLYFHVTVGALKAFAIGCLAVASTLTASIKGLI